jgi:hypothetical protein
MPGGPGMPGADQWYTPPAGPPPRRKRRGWLIPAGVAAAILVIVVALVLALSPGSHKAAAGASTSAAATQTHRASPSARPTPTVGSLQLAQFLAGDCLTGANMQLNTSSPWPKLTQAVPCGQGHTAEVFYANNNFWPKGGAYPSDSTIKKDATAECDSAFQSYVGIAYSKSLYTWTDIVPDVSTWPGGDRGLHCVAYYATSAAPAGATLHGSIKGTDK